MPEEIFSQLDEKTDDDYETHSSSSEASNIDSEDDLFDSEENLNLDSSTTLPSDWAVTGNERNPFAFRLPKGLKFVVQDKEDLVEFFDDEVMEHIATETNRFANQFLKEYMESLPRNSCALK